MNGLEYLRRQLKAVEELSITPKQQESMRASRTLLESAVALTMPDVELNDTQCQEVGGWISDIGGIGGGREIEYPRIRGMQLATYVNSCYRPK